jgi:putative membrane protein
MHAGKQYSLKELLLWTRRDIYALLVIATLPTLVYQWLEWHWIAIPWVPVALLGTVVAFMVSFKNNASYDRLWEARKIWGSLVNASRSWGLMVKDFPSAPGQNIRNHQVMLINRHLAWLTALRYGLRQKRSWEGIYQRYNQEYRERMFTVEEQKVSLHEALKPYLADEEIKSVIGKGNAATQLMALQSAHVRKLLDEQVLTDYRYVEMMRMLVEFTQQQGASERIKNFPYPRQYATANLYFTQIFVLMIPFGLLEAFSSKGELIWLTIPFSVVSSWIFTTMEKIGESTENPFEGSANDVPITAISRTIEIDLKEMMGMNQVPQPLTPTNNILV